MVGYKLRLYSSLMRVRPCQLADLLKKLLLVRRRIVETEYGKFWIDPASHFGISLLRDGVYEEHLTKLLISLLRPSDVFVDIGGNEGYFSVLAASLLAEGRVHCIEPQSRLQQVIRKNVEINGVASSVTLHKVALSDQIGEVDLYLRPSTNTGTSSMFRYWSIGSARERVPCLTLDSFMESISPTLVRFAKIDCEGAEGLIVSGGRRTLEQKNIQFLDIEYHARIIGNEACRRIHEQMRRFGYVLTRIGNGYARVYHLPELCDDLGALGDLSIDCDLEDD